MTRMPVASAPTIEALTKALLRSVGLIGFLLAGPSFSGARQAEPLKRFSYTEYHMGVDARLVVYAPSQNVAEAACTAAFERIAQLDSIMSDYQIHSELMRLCDHAGGAAVPVSPDLFKVLEVSQKVSTLSDGYFDVTVGPLVRLWRKAKKTHIMPLESDLMAAKKLVDYRNLTMDSASQSVRLRIPGMKLDLGAIGKGFADDEAQKVLEAHGIHSALVDMGGDIVVTDPPPGKKGWEFEVPNAGVGEKVPEMSFANCAVSTSGDTEEFVMIGGKRYSHVIDPHTGQALTQRVQATVICKTGLVADPVSTAMTLVGPSGRKRLIKAYPDLKVYVRRLMGK